MKKSSEFSAKYAIRHPPSAIRHNCARMFAMFAICHPPYSPQMANIRHIRHSADMANGEWCT
jgi:hypothetical protein